jgi:hypothetical protein
LPISPEVKDKATEIMKANADSIIRAEKAAKKARERQDSIDAVNDTTTIDQTIQ